MFRSINVNKNKFEILRNNVTMVTRNGEVVIAPKPNLPPRRESKAGQKEYGLDAGANPPCSEFEQVTDTMTNFNFISAPDTCRSQI